MYLRIEHVKVTASVNGINKEQSISLYPYYYQYEYIYICLNMYTNNKTTKQLHL